MKTTAFLLFIFALVSCNSEQANPLEERFFYEDGEKTPLVYATDRIAVLYQVDDLSKFHLDSFSLVASLPIIQFSPGNIACLNRDLSEEELFNFLEELESYDEVGYANPFVILSDGSSAAVGGTFQIELSDTSQLKLIKELVRETNTTLLGPNAFYGEEGPYWVAMSADKTSDGNALQMTNYFMANGDFKSAFTRLERWTNACE